MEAELLVALREFAEAVKVRFSANAQGEPEAQLTGPVSSLFDAVGTIVHRRIVAKAESRLGDRPGIPDFGLVVDGVLNGYIELKAPGIGADTSHYKGRDREQWDRFASQPNILYTDGNEWCLYQNGTPAGKPLRFGKDITTHGAKGVTDGDAAHFHSIITRMLAWQPVVPDKPKEQAELLAPLCRLLREDVADALRDADSPLVSLAKDWRSLLFPDASDERFADAYAQTVTFAILLARSEGADVSDMDKATAALEAEHTLLSRALRVLTDAKSRAEIEPSLVLLQRVINAFPQGAMQPGAGGPKGGTKDPWLYFYEHFLAAYDPKLRKDSGVYYTPVEVVRCQVALVDDLLRNTLHKAGGFTHKDVVTLDPAVGTGTYLLGVIDHALDAVRETQGAGAVAAKATTLAANIHGFELMTGPYAVSELRLTRSLRDRGASLPKDGLGVYLTDALDSPHATPPAPPTFLRPIADQHKHALEVKDKKSVIVCIGNPPYDRHDAVGTTVGDEGRDNRARTGGWVRWGEETAGSREGKVEYTRGKCILDDFIEPAKLAGHGGDLKNLYNLYVYFWRWAMWKVFEQPPMLDNGKRAARGDNAGIATFITAASYIRGDAFVGMREMLRRLCHQVYIIDLGGEGRGTRQDKNVFNIQTPVAICIAVRTGKKDKDTPAVVKYAAIRGTREEKYAKLASIRSFRGLKWKVCPADWHAPFRPSGTGKYFAWPLLTDLMPWQSNGVQLKRTWPIGSTDESLKRRWKALLMAEDRRKVMKESGDRTAKLKLDMLLMKEEWPERTLPISKLAKNAPMPPTVAYAYRSFDRQRVIADARLIARPRPGLWLAHSNKQVYLSSLFSQPLGPGPAAVASAHIPDLDTFRGSFGAKASFPLYRDAAARAPNILPGLLDLWGRKLRRPISPESFAAYVYALTANPGFVERFWDELEDCQLRVPLTLRPGLFCEVYAAGAILLHLHTFGERFQPPGTRTPQIVPVKARVKAAISDAPADYPETFEYIEPSKTLRIGTGAIAPVDPAVWNYEVSGLRVVRSWLGYRMKHRKGKKSSPLDDIHPERWTSDFTDELLRVLWILEATVYLRPRLDRLLDRVCNGPILAATDLPGVPPHLRKPPRAERDGVLFDGVDGDDQDTEE
ncbi:MAG: N-6 DNA methylase [Phycisphaerae bacterium]|nr:N-6 DNA methylase [Phycisphaerae bacterium]